MKNIFFLLSVVFMFGCEADSKFMDAARNYFQCMEVEDAVCAYENASVLIKLRPGDIDLYHMRIEAAEMKGDSRLILKDVKYLIKNKNKGDRFI